MTKEEKSVALRFIEHMQRLSDHTYEIARCPDEEDRSQPMPDCVIRRDDGRASVCEITSIPEFGGIRYAILESTEDLRQQVGRAFCGELRGTYALSMPSEFRARPKDLEILLEVISEFVEEKSGRLAVNQCASMGLANDSRLEDWYTWLKKNGYDLPRGQVELLKTQDDGSGLMSVGAGTAFVRGGGVPSRVREEDKQLAAVDGDEKFLLIDMERTTVPEDIMQEWIDRNPPENADKIIGVSSQEMVVLWERK